LPVLVTAAMRGEGEHVELTADELVSLDAVESERAAALRVVLDLDDLEETALERIKEYLLDHPGDLPVRFELLRRGDFRMRLIPPPALTVDGAPQTREGLEALLGRGWCEFEFETRTRNGVAPDLAPTPSSRPGVLGDPAEIVN
jgi:hypothetical protein